jgi:hypothetical protein
MSQKLYTTTINRGSHREEIIVSARNRKTAKKIIISEVGDLSCRVRTKIKRVRAKNAVVCNRVFEVQLHESVAIN